MAGAAAPETPEGHDPRPRWAPVLSVGAAIAATLWLTAAAPAAGQLATPVPSAEGQSLHWAAIPGATSYEVKTLNWSVRTPNPTTKYSYLEIRTTTATSYLPPCHPDPSYSTVTALGPGGRSQRSNWARTTCSPAPHVMVIVEENRNRSEVVGASDMPYFNSLASTFGSTTAWSGVTYPSLPNYLALISGSTQGVTDDGCSYSFSGPTIATQLAGAGIGWRAYEEGLPSAGSTTCEAYPYAKKHNPFAYFPTSNGPNVVPSSQFTSDLAGGKLPPFVFYVPGQCNDGHDCSNATVDTYLASLIPTVQASSWYAEGGTIIVTWDESNGKELIPTIVVSAAGGTQTLTTPGNHCGTLATLEDLYEVPRLGCAVGASTLAPLLSPLPPPPPPPPTLGSYRSNYIIDAASYFDPFSGNEAWIKAHASAIRGYPPFSDVYLRYGLPVTGYHDIYTGNEENGTKPLTPTMRAEYVAEVQRDAALGYAGTFMDDVNFCCGNKPSSEVQSESDYRTELANLLEAIHTAEPTKQLYVNAQFSNIWPLMKAHEPQVERALKYVTLMEKEFGVGPNSGINSRSRYEEFFAYVDTLHAKGIHLAMGVDNETVAEWEYDLATYFLLTDGFDHGVSNAHGTPLSFWPGWDVNLGTPTSGRERASNGVWKRSFSAGVVYANEPGNSTQTVTLPQPMRNVEGRLVSSVTLAGASGTVLQSP